MTAPGEQPPSDEQTLRDQCTAFLTGHGPVRPDWDDLRAQTGWARDRGAAAHLDGARLWESAAGYGRPPAEIAALFDTVYVSFYKGLGALAGCCLAGPADILAEVREWRRRMGGTLFGLWPGAASGPGRTPWLHRTPTCSGWSCPWATRPGPCG